MKKQVICAMLAMALSIGAIGCTSIDLDKIDSKTEEVTESQEQENTEGEAAEDVADEQKAGDTDPSKETSDEAAPENADNTAADNTASDAEGATDTVDTSNVDFSQYHEEDIKKEVEAAVASATSVQDEIDRIKKIDDKYSQMGSKAMTQTDMDVAAGWTLKVWDDELNSLWSRISDNADSKTKERILAEQRQWNAMKEELLVSEIGTREESGTIYPVLYMGTMEQYTENRCHILANELAKIKGESYKMPERWKYSAYVDNQGTDSIYSYVYTSVGMEGDEHAVISLYRIGELEGTYTDKGNGELEFVSSNGIKGYIHFNGWEGASFEVTESDGSLLSVGEVFEFPFAF